MYVEYVEMYYRGYFITGNSRIGYVVVSPYGTFSSCVYDFIIEAKKAIVDDLNSVI